MPQSVLVQVGQCGNQIGFNFWKSLLQEYKCHFNELSDDDFSQFLKPKSTRILPSNSIVEDYSARGILIDMEERVINEGLRSSIGSLFLPNQILKDNAGSGNNWAVGHVCYGTKYHDTLEELYRVQVETCDNLEAFLFVFSLSGGTGSGLGTYALKVVQDFYPKTSRVAFCVYPSFDVDDVITSPYNAALSNYILLEHADMIVPFGNNVMDKIFSKLESNKFLMKMIPKTPKKDELTNFEKLNNLIVSTIINSTSISRYESVSSKALRDLILNLNMAEHLKYGLPSLYPIFPSDESSAERLFNEIFCDDSCLFYCNQLKKQLLGAVVISRGQKLVSTVVQKNLDRITKLTPYVGPNSMQHSECPIGPVGSSSALVMFSNSSSISTYLSILKCKLQKMASRKCYLHHYKNEDEEVVNKLKNSVEKLNKVLENYQEFKILRSAQ